MRYSKLEKMVYTVVMASKKLKHYFAAHPINVPTTFLIQEILANKEVTRRISKWAAELTPLSFVSYCAIKSQVLADLVVEWTPPTSVTYDVTTPTPAWVAFIDGD